MMKVYKRYENATFDNFQGSDELKKILSNVSELRNNIVIWGGVGLGKTHLAYAVLNKECKIHDSEGYKWYDSKNIMYTNIKEMIDTIRSRWKEEYCWFYNFIDDCKNVDVLIIDEVGVQYGSESERIELFDVFNERYNNCLPVIVLSNYSPEDMKKVLGLRITDRIMGDAKIFELKGESKR